MSEPSISLTRFNEAHIGGGTALYNDPGSPLRCCFETEGLLRDYAVRDGRWVDTLAMARLR